MSETLEVSKTLEEFRQDFLNILECDNDPKSIKKAFHQKALILHPDKPEGDEEKFKKLNEAYKYLSDPKLLEEKYQEKIDIARFEKLKEEFNYDKEKLREYLEFFKNNEEYDFEYDLELPEEEDLPFSEENFYDQEDDINEFKTIVQETYEELWDLLQFRWTPSLKRRAFFKLKKINTKPTEKVIESLRDYLQRTVEENPLKIKLWDLYNFICELSDAEYTLHMKYITKEEIEGLIPKLKELEKNLILTFF